MLNFLNEIQPNTLATVSGIFSLLIVFGGTYFLYTNKGRSLIPAHKLKTAAISLGMLFTFMGVFVGLYNFDTANIANSVPILLEGLKTAFMTSIAGLFVAILAGFSKDASGEVAEDNAQDEADWGEKIVTELTQIKQGIAGEGDGSLSTQIMKLRTDQSDHMRSLKDSFDAFATKMADSNIDALTEAINKVLADFNTTINEKLGVAFEKLSNSSDTLYQWQQENKQQIQDLTEVLTVIRESLHASEASVQSSAVTFEKIAEVHKKFEELTNQLHQNIDGGITLSSSLKTLSADLEGSAETIKKEVKEIAYGAANEMEETMNKTLADFGTNLAAISQKLASDYKEIQQVFAQMKQE